MERITLAQFRDEEYDASHDVGVYVVFNDACCLYVGMSTSNIWNRWFYGTFRSHFDQHHTGEWIGNSPVARSIAKFMPQSWEWPIELWRASDCADHFSGKIQQLGFRPDRLDVRACEHLLISHYKPLLNRQS